MTTRNHALSLLALSAWLAFLPAPSHAAAPAATARRPAAEVIRLRKVAVRDEQIFGRRAEVVSLLIPADWSFKGGYPVDLNAFRFCPENAFNGGFQAQSADGTVAIAAYPSMQTVHFQNPLLAEDARRRAQMGQGFCPQRPPSSLGQFVEQVLVPAFRPGARVLGVEPVPVLQQNIRTQIAALTLPPGMSVNGDGAEVVIGYEVQGQQVEEHIYVVGGRRAESAGMGSAGPDVIYSVYTPVIGLRVPAGQFKPHQQQFANIIATMRGDPQFHAAVISAVQQQRAALFNNLIGEIRATSDIWRRSWEAASNATKQKEAAAQQRQSYDVAGAWSDTVLDVQNYKDTSGETVQLSGGYNHVFSNRNGEYIQTNDPSYNPAVATGGNWEAIAAIPR
jgi:hypothetical protein